jgi:tRNA (guanine-N7-)-methyltransferase
MRLKYKDWTKPLIAAHPEKVLTMDSLKALFHDTTTISLEVGCGKGGFICKMAKKYPHTTFIAIEKNQVVLGYALQAVLNASLPNVYLYGGDVINLGLFGLPAKVENIYLNFSDPWPKERHEKKRLTYKNYLHLFETLLGPKGRMILKTDQASLFEYSITSLTSFGYKINESNPNYILDEEADALTEYEKKFRDANLPIYRLIATRS